jgi:hypothetical protein
MQKLLVVAAVAASLFFVPGITWGQAPIEREAPPTRRSNLTLEQRHVIKEIIKDRKTENAPADIQVVVGDTVPNSIRELIRLRKVPPVRVWPSSGRPSSNWCSTSSLPRPSASPFRRSCSRSRRGDDDVEPYGGEMATLRVLNPEGRRQR